VSLQLRLLPNLSNLQLASILLEYRFVMILPKLLRRILPADSLQDLSATRVFVNEIGHVVDGVVDYNVLAVTGRGGVFRHVGGGECFGHGCGDDARGGDIRRWCCERGALEV